MDLGRRILSDVTVYTKYAKHLPEAQRRETWDEVVDRNKAMHLERFPELAPEIERAYQFVYARQAMPSMRSMQFAGRAAEVNPVRMYNCSYLPIDDPQAFPEVMFLLLSGTGVGYSVQRHHVANLPEIRKPTKHRRFLIGDSIEGWADAVKVLVRAYFYGKPLPVFDFRGIRPKGSRLVTSGGKAPGPEPLRVCLQRIQAVFDRFDNGDRLQPIDVHDICCFIADAVLSGGIRRAAMIALFDLDDRDMRTAKSNFACTPLDFEYDAAMQAWRGYVARSWRMERVPVVLSADEHAAFQESGTLPWFYFEPQRGRANNTAVIVRHKIDRETFLQLWADIEASQAGEPGVFFTNDKDWGLNPCAEVSLRPFQFCNLGTIPVADVTTQEELERRAWAVAFLCTLQAAYTDFHYLRPVWKTTTEKERLIGVSMTGVATPTFLQLDERAAAHVVTTTNAEIARRIGIAPAARCTVLKPEGTTSCVVGTSSGNHAWYARWFLRSMRLQKNESMYQYLARFQPELLEDDLFAPSKTALVRIPIAAPDGAITRESESALDLLARVSRLFQRWIVPGHRKGANYNNVSTTVSIKPDEWAAVGAWMWTHRDEFTALSVLPYDGGTYRQAPFEALTRDEYERRASLLRPIDVSQILEVDDATELQQELACAGGACEV